MVSTQGEKEYRFLKDQPLQTAEEFKKMKFGHVDIANTLADIVERCDTPFTVGLFGKWGSGKSSVAYCTKDELMERGIPVVIFDVWKHEGGFLRRCFLKDCYEQLSRPKKNSRKNYFRKPYTLDERLEHGVTRTRQGSIRPNTELLRQMKKPALLGLILIAVLGAICAKFGWMDKYQQWLIAVLSSSVLFTIILSFLANVLTTERTTYSTDRLQDPYEFEKEFGKLIAALEPGKLLIIFDNLDRVPHEKAVETLCTMKTFLEPADVKDTEHQIVFLIPCDDDAIKAHLGEKQAMQDNGALFDHDEFLRKFFNATLRISKFIPSELQAFSAECLRETRVQSLDDGSIAWLITKAFRDNPRQIIQFVNVLVSNFVLISSREGAGKDFQDNFFLEHRKEICLYLILAEKYPKVMARLRDDHARSLSDASQQQGEGSDGEADDFRTFLEQVCPEVTIQDLSAFHTLRRSEQEKNFPGIQQLFIHLEDNQIEQAYKSGERIPNLRDDPEGFSLAVAGKLETITNVTSALYFVNSLLHLVKQFGASLTRQAYSDILSLIRRKASDRIDIIDPQHLHDTMLVRCPDFGTELAKLWLSRFETISQDEDSRRANVEYARRLLRVLRDNPDIVAPIAPDLKSLLARLWVSELEIVEILVERDDAQGALLSPQFVKGFVDSLEDKDFVLCGRGRGEDGERPGRLQLLVRFSTDLFDAVSAKLMLTKLTHITRARTAPNWRPAAAGDWKVYFECVHTLLKRHDVCVVSDSPEFNAFIDAAVDSAQKIPDTENRRMCVPLLVLLESSGSTHKKPERDKLLTEFFEQATLAAYQYCFEQVGDTAKLMQKPRSAVFQKRSMKDLEFFEFFYPLLSKKEKGAWVLGGIRQNLLRMVGWIRKQNYEVPSMNTILQDLLKLTASSSIPEKKECFRVCNETECIRDDSITAKYVEQLKAGLLNPDPGHQKVAADALSEASFLGEAHQRGVAKDTLDWLWRLPDSEKHQPHSIRALVGFRDHLNDQEKEQLAQLCFDHLIRTPKQAAAVTQGFEVLKQLGSPFCDRKHNLIDIKNRLAQEHDQTVRTALTKGLRDLRPAEPAKGTKDFWGWVDKLENKA